MAEATPVAIVQTNFTCKNLHIINARLPGYPNLQQIWIDSQGNISQILPMGTVLKRVPAPELQVLDVAEDWVSLGDNISRKHPAIAVHHC